MSDDGNINEKKSSKLVALNVRFNVDVLNGIREISQHNNMSSAEIIRLCVDDKLAKFLKNTEFIDEEQGYRIEEQNKRIEEKQQKTQEILFDTLTELQVIRRELNRIGINYNREIKLKNIRNKYPDRLSTVQIQQILAEEEEIEKDKSLRWDDEIRALLERFDEIAGKAGEALCHIVV